jgi:hypothetical protein
VSFERTALAVGVGLVLALGCDCAYGCPDPGCGSYDAMTDTSDATDADATDADATESQVSDSPASEVAQTQ